MLETRQIIGLMLVQNDERFVGQALSNIMDFCDRVIVLFHKPADKTPQIVQAIAVKAGNKVEVHRVANVEDSHAFVLPFIGSSTWMFAVDGDEVYDPSGLARLRPCLLSGEFDCYWRLYGHVLNVTRLDLRSGVARGHSSPPGHPMTKLYNLGAIASWTDALQRLHGGTMTLKPGWNREKGLYAFFHHMEWDASPFRCLHMVFIRRSSWRYTLGPPPAPADVIHRRSLGVDAWSRMKLWLYYEWIALRRKTGKDNSYRKGPQVERDTSAFFSKDVSR